MQVSLFLCQGENLRVPRHRFLCSSDRFLCIVTLEIVGFKFSNCLCPSCEFEINKIPQQVKGDGTKEERPLLVFPYSFPLTSQDPAAVVKQEALLVTSCCKTNEPIRTLPLVLRGH